LTRYQPASGAAGWKARLGLARRRGEPPQGLYMFGPVGTGKSLLMDLFFAASPVEAKRRVHFHAFMQEVHARLHALRQAVARGKSDRGGADRAKSDRGGADRGGGESLPRLAAEMAAEAWLLCFDEFHVVNIADAMILGRLFEALLENGVIVVLTSNSAPDDLYAEGLKRENFLPFIGLLKARLDVLQLDNGRDYRLQRLQNEPVYYTPIGAKAKAALTRAFGQLTDGAVVAPATIEVSGRVLKVPAAARGVARFGFAPLCEAALGAGDYLALAARFHTLVLDGVPCMAPDQRNEAKRFMTLIDTLYEHRVNLVMSAAGPPEALYPKGTGAKEFQRTVSRLMEMRSRDYIAQAHRP
jgi:cell division protein ZapE